MGRARTIRGAEALQGHGDPMALLQLCGPLVFTTARVIRIPDLYKVCHSAQVIDVPMRSRRTLAVVRDTRQHPAGTEGAAHVHIEARLHVQLTKPANL